MATRKPSKSELEKLDGFVKRSVVYFKERFGARSMVTFEDQLKWGTQLLTGGYKRPSHKLLTVQHVMAFLRADQNLYGPHVQSLRKLLKFRDYDGMYHIDWLLGKMKELEPEALLKKAGAREKQIIENKRKLAIAQRKAADAKVDRGIAAFKEKYG